MNDLKYVIKEVKPIGLGLMLLAGLISCLCALLSLAQGASYANSMRSLNTAAAPAPGASKVVVYLEDDAKYTNKYVSEAYLAEAPEDVAAVVLLKEGRYLYGFYGGGVNGYVRTVTLQWFDLGTQQVLAETTLEGSPPPNSIKSSQKSDQYGTYPTTAINKWILEGCQVFLH